MPIPAELAAQFHRFQIWDSAIEVYDHPHSYAAGWVASELVDDNYGLSLIPFSPGDMIVDIGGHIGLFAIAVALKHPDLHIYSYEPHPYNFALFQHNLLLNGVTNVHLFPEGVSGDGHPIALAGNPTNSGGMSRHTRTNHYAPVSGVPTFKLDEIFDRHNIHHCRLLKMDCEGSEYDALQTTQVWSRIDHLCGEFHTNSLLEARGHCPEQLARTCVEHLGPERVRVSSCKIDE